MIIDNLKNCGLYYGAHKRFEAAFDFIKKAEEEFEKAEKKTKKTNLFTILENCENQELEGKVWEVK